ncbi:MAG: alkane 1-monooxygenase [Bdellovibrionales bacterium]
MIYLFCLTIPLSVAFSLHQENALSFFGLAYSFVLLPFVELLLPKNFSPKSSLSPKVHNFLLFLLGGIHLLTIPYYLVMIPEVKLFSMVWFGQMSALGMSCAVLGINIAHELGHRRDALSQNFAKALLTSSLYSHFFWEHNYGHHKNVATPEDPSTAKIGQNVYGFIVKSVYATISSGIEIGRNFKAKNSLNINPVLQWKAIEFLFFGGSFLVFGINKGLFILLAAIFGFTLLEIVNYVEHYGLLRKKLKTVDRYEPVQPIHSWNSNHFMSRSLLFELSRHSDHHANSYKEYFKLEDIDGAPQLPTGYPGMMLLSLVPSLWYKVMDPRVHSFKQKIAETK